MENKSIDQTTRLKKFRNIFGILSSFIIFISQIVLYNTLIDDSNTIPSILWVGILALVFFVLSQLIKPSERILGLVNQINLSHSALCVIGSIVFSLVTIFAMVLFDLYGRFSYIPVLSIWCISALFYIFSFPLPKISRESISNGLKDHRVELILLAGVLVVGAFVRFYRLGDIPRVINGDEGSFGLLAQATTYGRLANPFVFFSNMGALYLQVLNLSIQAFGVGAYAIRFPSAVAGVFAIIATYIFTRLILGRRIAFITAGLIAMSHVHINFSRTGTGYIQDTWLIPLEMALLFNGLEKRRSWQTALSGMLLALHFVYYLTAIAVLGMIFGFLVLCWILHKKWFKTTLKQIVAFLGGVFIMALPALYYFVKSPLELMARFSLEGTFQNRWFQMQIANTDQNIFQVVGGRIVHAFLSLIYFPALDFYGSPTPMLSMLTSTFFLIGIGVGFLQIRKRSILLLNSLLWGGTLLIGLFTIPPSADSYRMVIVLPFAMVLAAMGLDQTLSLVGQGWESSKKRYIILSLIMLFLVFAANIGTYFGEFAGRCQYGGNLESRFASYLGNYVAGFQKEARVYLLADEIYFYGSHPSVDFLSRSHPITNVIDPLETQTYGSGDILVASPKRIGELEDWIHAHPGGQIEYKYDCATKILLGYVLP